jgi:putative radical SAM enzyme (TIGR03279 family)
MHAQIVLCPGLNDGPHLDRSVRELAELHPQVATVAVVPVGLTRHRDGLYPLRAVTPDEARTLLTQVDGWQADLKRRIGTRFVFGADELYLAAGRPIPPAGAYEGFPVVEDGIGLVRRFEDDLRRLAGRSPTRRGLGRAVTVVTGTLFAPVLERLLDEMALGPPRVDVAGVTNDFFGPAIGVAGLLTGEDIARAMAGRALGEAIVVPAVALQESRGVFLDDATPTDLAQRLGVPVETPEASARGLLDALRPRRGSERPARSV